MKIEFETKALKFLSKLEKGNKERVFKKLKEERDIFRQSFPIVVDFQLQIYGICPNSIWNIRAMKFSNHWLEK